MEIKTLKCPECSKEVYKLPFGIGWAHEPFSTCKLDDGINLAEFSTETGFKLKYLVIEESKEILREAFIKRFDYYEGQLQQNGSLNPKQFSPEKKEDSAARLNGEEIHFDDEKSKKQIKKQFLSTFQPYFD